MSQNKNNHHHHHQQQPPLPSSALKEDMVSSRRKELFGDCALIEIIHLHDCLRGALKALETDVHELTSVVIVENESREKLLELERRVASRFKVIWSVFRSHSSAEDEFIWPALRLKTAGKIGGSNANNKHSEDNNNNIEEVIVQKEYEDDHADEERMFGEMDSLLKQLREALVHQHKLSAAASLDAITKNISTRVKGLSEHLHAHLEKEETNCMPLVVTHLTKNEIHELVGNIMGKRSADTIANIMTMAVQNLDDADREEMVKYMKQSMAGTFFDRWLQMSGWMSTSRSCSSDEESGKKRGPLPEDESDEKPSKTKRTKDDTEKTPSIVASSEIGANFSSPATSSRSIGTTSQSELEKLIRAVASNPALTPEQKNTTIQGLRDSVWKLNQRLKEQQQVTVVNEVVTPTPAFLSHNGEMLTAASSCGRARRVRVTPPSMYYKKTKEGKIQLIWNSDSPTRLPDNSSVPLFSAAELAPTYHDGAAGTVLGCPHYARACKLRHPKSGRLYTCRLCCQQQRELPTTDADEPLDRYEVTEVMCMKCNTLQPAEDRCINPDCESQGKPFARYFCRICHLYDDGSRPIFHCPYCNICKVGLGLGQDFRHCMRCNACVSLSDSDHHCIPQKLQGDCPICHESLFQSTEPLRGLRCGHVMHLTCFTNYRRGLSYTCPLCMRSMEDMSDYFSMLDTAVRMQPMPAAYLSTMSNIYCQDCGKTGQVQYHFVGQKCPHCGSYNTREMGRVHNATS